MCRRGHLSDEAPEAYTQYVEDAELRRRPRRRADLRQQQTLGEKCGLAFGTNRIRAVGRRWHELQWLEEAAKGRRSSRILQPRT